MAARMISLLRFKGRRVATLVCFGAACLMFMVSSLSPWLVLVVLWSVRSAVSGCCLAPDGLNSRAPILARPPHRGETSATMWGVGSRHISPSPPEHRVAGYIWSYPPPVRSRDGGYDTSPGEETLRAPRSGRPTSHVPIRAERSTPYSQSLPCSGRPTRGGVRRSRNETVWPQDRARSRTLRDRPLNRKTLSDRPTPPTIPQRTANYPEQPIERSDHDSQTSHEDCNARVDDEPFHHEAHGTSASVTTTRKPVLRAYTARVVERPGKWNTVAKTHFQSNLSDWMGGLVYRC